MNQLPTRWQMPRYREGKPTPGRVSQRSLERVGAVRLALAHDYPPPTRPNTHGAPARATRSSAYAGAMAAAAGAALEPTGGRCAVVLCAWPSALREQQHISERRGGELP